MCSTLDTCLQNLTIDSLMVQENHLNTLNSFQSAEQATNAVKWNKKNYLCSLIFKVKRTGFSKEKLLSPFNKKGLDNEN